MANVYLKDMREPPVIPSNPSLYQWLYELWLRNNRIVQNVLDALPSDAFNIVIITADYTANIYDDVIICNSASSITLTMPQANATGRIHYIKNINTGTVTVDANGSETIDDELTQNVYQWDDMQIADYYAGKWVII